MLCALILGALSTVVHPAPGVELRLDLREVPIARADAQLWVDGRLASVGESELLGDLRLWSGKVEGKPDSYAFLAESRHGSRGWIEYGEHVWHLVAEPDPVLGWNQARSQ
ncbi:MAG: hypothetical protein FJ299_03285 [Planctomycetes bacterium]|nr:hypothetical protein [Planctomycetota bacterium]